VGRVVLGSTLPERLAQGVAERVVALVIESLDVNRLLARIDMNALLDQVDIDGLVERIDPEVLLDRFDVNAVLARIDIDVLIERVDIDALVARTDLAGMMTNTATGAADNALGALRRSVVRADTSVARAAARLLGRP
jgi:hypothetical protein